MSRLIFVLLSCLLWPLHLNASDIKLSIADWQFNDIQAENIRVNVELTSKGLALKAYADSIELPSAIKQLKEVELDCTELQFYSNQISCRGGQLKFYQRDLGRQTLTFSISSKPESNQHSIKIKGLSLAAGKLDANVNYADGYWRIAATGNQLSLEDIQALLIRYLPKIQVKQLNEWQMGGVIQLSVDAQGKLDNLKTAKVKLEGTAITVGDNSGKYASEMVNSQLTLNIQKQAKNWQWQSDVKFMQGQSYVDPVFVDFDETPIQIQTSGSWQQDNSLIQISQFDFQHQGIAEGSATLELKANAIEQLELTINKTELEPLYQHWLQPFSVGTAADDMILAGKVKLHYLLQADDYQIDIAMDKVRVEDANQRFTLQGLTGNLAWSTSQQNMTSDLEWQAASLYAIPIGYSSFKAISHDSTLQLLEPWSVPILDGELQISTLHLGHQEKTTNWTFDGLVTPISMESLSAALDWPVLHGKLSGIIPKVSYSQQQIQIDGALMVKLFEGTTIIRDLRLNKPFGTLPQLYGNIDLVGLDLETVTKTFEFGRITGKLDGKIANLRLSNWQPVQFDAQFATPKGDKSRRRISQQAVNNLSQLGGGAGGILSKSFLRFFEDFSYKRLGLSCQLRNEVCSISGVGETERGYYIVKGGGLPPRINVIGYTRQVDWPELIARLQAVSNSSGPVVK